MAAFPPRPPCLGAGYRTSENAATFLALTANLLLAWLVVRRSQNELHAFKNVIFLGCLVDITFAITCNVFEVHHDFRHGVFVAVNNGPLVFDDVWSNHLVYSLYCFPVYFTISYIAVPMIFRYFLVCRNHALSGLQLTLLVVVTAIPTGCLSAAEYLLWHSTSVKAISMRRLEVDNDDCYDKGEIPLFHFDDLLIPAALTPIAAAGTIVSLSYIVIVFCIFSMRRTMRNGKMLSEKTRRLQKQLDFVFVVQSLNPFVLIVVPVTGCILTILGFEQFMPLARLATGFLSWIAVCNPISAMIFIKSYRRALVEYARKVMPRALLSRVEPTLSTTTGSEIRKRQGTLVKPTVRGAATKSSASTLRL